MLKYFLLILMVAAIEGGLLVGFSFLLEADLLTTLFFGSIFFVFLSYTISSTGGLLSKNSEAKVYYAQAGSYQPKHEKETLKINPFLLGSVLCFISYFIISAVIGS